MKIEIGPNPISGNELVPIGILLSITLTHHTEVTPSACWHVRQPSKSFGKHASSEAKAKSGQGDTNSAGLNGERWHAKLPYPQASNKILQKDMHAVCDVPKQANGVRNKTPMK